MRIPALTAALAATFGLGLFAPALAQERTVPVEQDVKRIESIDTSAATTGPGPGPAPNVVGNPSDRSVPGTTPGVNIGGTPTSGPPGTGGTAGGPGIGNR